MKLALIGLRNPEAFLSETRHNMGFIVVNEFSKKWGTGDWNISNGRKHFWKKCILPDLEVIAVAANTNINLSGDVVKEAIKEHKLSVADIMVVYDDVEVNLGNWKFKPKGAAGGHNGIRDIINVIGSDFYRCRVGIGPRDKILCDYVLSKFTEKEIIVLESVVDDMCDAIRQKLVNLSCSHKDRGNNEEK